MADTLLTIPVYNEAARIALLIERLRQNLESDVEALFVDDASSDGTSEVLAEAGFEVIRHPARRGCGPSVRTGLLEGLRRGCDLVAVMAGNGKDDPALLPRLLLPLRTGEADFVQGSRYVAGGGHANMPRHRLVGTRLYSLAFSILAGQRILDATNGFRALRSSILEDPRIDIHQTWLTDYEIESYLFFKAIQLGYRVTEAPVTKLYPESGEYTKMRPFTGWWSHFRPALLLSFRVKR